MKMLRQTVVMRGLFIAAAIALPGGVAAAAADDSGADDSALGDDMEWQIDLMLGLVPDDEVAAYYAEQAQASELDVQNCMNEAGFEYNPDPQAMSNTDPRADMTPLEWAEQYGFGIWTQMDPDRDPYASVELTEWVNQDIVESLSEDESNAWFEANDLCSAAAYAEDDIFRNPMVQEALADFYATVAADPRVVEAEETWSQCMADAGQPFESQDALFEQIYAVWNGDQELAALQQQFFESQAWEEDSPDHAQWQELVDEEIAVAVADAGCSPALEQVREDVRRDLRPELVAVWETIDWDLPADTVTADSVTADPVTADTVNDDAVTVDAGPEDTSA